MRQPLDIEAGGLRARVLPGAGGGPARFDRCGPSGWIPVLRPYDGAPDMPMAAMRLALNVLAPFSNRLSDGVTGPDGQRHAVEPNVPGETYPIHGDGWLAAWRVMDVASDRTRLMHAGAIGPWRYEAMLDYVLADGALRIDLEATNTGPAMPFGLGLHPWFLRAPGTTLRAAADAQWLEGPGHLPTERVDLDDPRAFDARNPALLPDGWINAGFDGWNGIASLRDPDGAGVRMEITRSEPPADRYVLYSPDPGCGFVCVEPTTHAIDAPSLPGGATAHGMAVLPTGGRARLSCQLTPFEKETS